jgi:peptide chain release factor 2
MIFRGISMTIFQISILAVAFRPYPKVRLRCTEYETGNTHAVLDGDLDAFVEAYFPQNI